MSDPLSAPPPPPPPDDAEAAAVTGRRKLLLLATGVGACALAVAAAGPSVVLALAPLGGARGGGKWVRAVKLNQLKEGEPLRVSIVDDRRDAWLVEKGVVLGSVWLQRRGEKVLAFSAVCPHLGCSVNVAGGGAGFACPCHTSAFDDTGKRTAGPAPRDLDALETRIEDGHVSVDFRRFRIGISEKVEA